MSADAAKLNAIRAELPASVNSIYLNAGTNGPVPRRSAEAMADWINRDLLAGRIGPDAMSRVLETKTALKLALATFVGCEPEALAITESTTAGIHAALGDLSFDAGDEVVTTDGEHGGVLVPLHLLERRAGVLVRLAAVGRRGGDISPEIASQITSRTRLVVVSHVSWTTGAVYDLVPLVALCRERGIPLVVDGAQSAGAIPLVLDTLGVDYYAFSGQKWLLGPDGLGGLWMSPGRHRPPVVGGERTLVAYDDSPYLEGTRRLETGRKVSPIALAGGLASVRWLLEEVGPAWLLDRAGRLARDTAERLSGIRGVEVITPAEMGTLVVFQIGDGDQAGFLEALTDNRILARLVPEGRAAGGPQVLRLSIGFWVSENDIDVVLDTVSRLARTT
ncbi:MAG: aminotransferase class V-fold PLP-dependent enzyme [Dehalococcoidia bacterium]